jgi:type IV secretory pathway VirB2 component (pilin)
MRRLLLAGVSGVAVATVASGAWASTTSGLAVDTWLHNTMTSFVGPVAYAAVLVGIVIAGSRLMSGGDLHGFFRALIMLAVIAGLTLGGQTVIGMMSANAAVVARSEASSAKTTNLPQPEGST